MNLDSLAIGVDIEPIARFKGKSDAFYKKIFTERERQYCESNPYPEQHYAVRFCAKEAFIKAVNDLGYEKVNLTDIEIGRAPSGAPMIDLPKDKGLDAKISMSHDDTKAVACVVIIKKG